MKTRVLTITVLLLSCISMSAQHNCSRFYPMEEGTTFEYTMYNKKGKTDGVSSYRVTTVDNNGDSTTATMAISFTDDKGKDVYNSNYSFTCSGNLVTIDYESLVPKEMLEQYKDMEMDITGTDIELPNELTVGQNLADANVTLNVSMSGLNMKTTIDIVNRKVEKQETVTTPAGTFDCYVIYSDNKSKIMMVKSNFPSRVWLSESVGMVKQETYKKNGDVMGSSQLTKFTK